MIPSGVQIFLASTPVDMRLSFERLAGLVREHLGYEPRSGALFVFFGKRRDGDRPARRREGWVRSVDA